MKPLPLIIASLMTSAPAVAGESAINDARQEDKIIYFCENFETGDRIEFYDENIELCPAGYSGFRNVTDSIVIHVEDASPQEELSMEDRTE
ncbi:hypothetical protein [Histidinibacterium lentulum]|uniref:hypothetical protein n=1 Tax=Histidinibacterium lentulum TaxID=2480588 RepID=UPI000F4D0B8C|nr:hypothetical protein [Histidinibacterium lentulum]